MADSNHPHHANTRWKGWELSAIYSRALKCKTLTPIGKCKNTVAKKAAAILAWIEALPAGEDAFRTLMISIQSRQGITPTQTPTQTPTPNVPVQRPQTQEGATLAPSASGLPAPTQEGTPPQPQDDAALNSVALGTTTQQQDTGVTSPDASATTPTDCDRPPTIGSAYIPDYQEATVIDVLKDTSSRACTMEELTVAPITALAQDPKNRKPSKKGPVEIEKRIRKECR
eukprot:g14656.t1